MVPVVWRITHPPARSVMTRILAPATMCAMVPESVRGHRLHVLRLPRVPRTTHPTVRAVWQITLLWERFATTITRLRVMTSVTGLVVAQVRRSFVQRGRYALLLIRLMVQAACPRMPLREPSATTTTSAPIMMCAMASAAAWEQRSYVLRQRSVPRIMCKMALVVWLSMFQPGRPVMTMISVQTMTLVMG